MNLPSLNDFVRDPGAAWCAQHAEYEAMARECLAAARGSYGIARKVHLSSARHYGKLARMTLQAASQNFPQGTAMERGVHPGHNERRTGNSIRAGHFFFFGGFGLLIQALSREALRRGIPVNQLVKQVLLSTADRILRAATNNQPSEVAA